MKSYFAYGNYAPCIGEKYDLFRLTDSCLWRKAVITPEKIQEMAKGVFLVFASNATYIVKLKQGQVKSYFAFGQYRPKNGEKYRCFCLTDSAHWKSVLTNKVEVSFEILEGIFMLITTLPANKEIYFVKLE